MLNKFYTVSLLSVLLTSTSAFASQTKIDAAAISKVESVKTIETSQGKIPLPQVETAVVVKKTDTSLFNGESTNVFDISVSKHEIKNLSDVVPMMSLGKLYVSVDKNYNPQSNDLIFHTNTVQKGLLNIALGKETAYIASKTVETKNGIKTETLTPDLAVEGFNLLINTKRTKDNNLLSDITLSEQKVTKMKDLGEGVSGPDYEFYSLSNRVFSKPGETLIIHSAPYKSGDKNFQNIYYITIR